MVGWPGMVWVDVRACFGNFKNESEKNILLFSILRDSLSLIGVSLVFNRYFEYESATCNHCQTTLPSLPSGRFLFILPPSLNEVISIPLSLKSPHCVFWSGIKQEINTTARMLLHAEKQDYWSNDSILGYSYNKEANTIPELNILMNMCICV